MPAGRMKLYGAFATVYLIWGSTYLGIKISLETIPPFLGAGVRFLIAGALVYAWIPKAVKNSATRAQLDTAVAAGALMIFGAYGATFWAQQTIPSGVTSLIVATAPVWFMVLSVRLENRTLTWSGLSGIVLGLVGVVLLLDPIDLSDNPVDPWGAIVLVLAAFSWAWGSFHFRRGFHGASISYGNSLTMLVGGFLLLVLSAVTGELSRLDLGAVSLRSYLALAYLIVFGSILTFSAYLWLLRSTDPVKVSTYAFVNPVVAVVLGWLLAGEVLDIRIGLSTSAIVLAVVLVLRSDPRRRE